MTKLKINRIFAYIFIVISFLKVIFSLIFIHTSNLGESIFHYVENIVHIVLLVLLVKQAIKNKIGHFFHEYFLEAVIMGVISSISLIYTCLVHDYSLDDSFIKVVPAILSLVVNVFLFISFHHHHDRTVKFVLIAFVSISLVLSVNSVVGNFVEYLNNEFSIELFLTTLISNVLSLVFNVFVLLTAISMKHVLRSNPNQVVNYVKLEEDEK